MKHLIAVLALLSLAGCASNKILPAEGSLSVPVAKFKPAFGEVDRANVETAQRAGLEKNDTLGGRQWIRNSDRKTYYKFYGIEGSGDCAVFLPNAVHGRLGDKFVVVTQPDGKRTFDQKISVLDYKTSACNVHTYKVTGE